MRLLTLFVRYGDADYESAFKRLCQLYQRVGGLDYDALLIDNTLSPGVHAWLGPRTLLVGGDNTRREFSGWDVALTYLGSAIECYDLVHVVTSAFENEYNGFYPYINYGMFEFAAKNRHVVLAHVDAYPAPVRLMGRSFQTWGCSKFVMAVPERIRALGTFEAGFPSNLFFTASRTTPFRQDAPLSENYRRYLVDWLTGEGLPHGQWHSVFELSEANLQRFRAKAMSIINEHSLSMRLRESGAQIVDYTWLYSYGLSRDGTKLPDECTQVAERNLYLFGNPIIEPGIDLTNHRGTNVFQRMFHLPGHQPFGRTSVIDALWLGNAVLRQYLDPARPLHCAAIYLNQGAAIDDEQRAWLAEPDDDLPQDGVLPLTRGLHAVYLARDDLREAFDLNDASGRRGLIRWWCNDGRVNPDYRDFIAPSVYLQPDEAVEQDMPIPLTRGMCAFHHSRDDLAQSMDLGTVAGRRAFVSWWIVEALRDPELNGFMNRDVCVALASDIVQDTCLPITQGLRALHAAHADLAAIGNLDTSEGRAAFVEWWIAFGMHDPRFAPLIPASAYVEIDPSIEQDALIPITRFMRQLCARDEEIDVGKPAGRRALTLWWARAFIGGRLQLPFTLTREMFGIGDDVDPAAWRDVHPLAQALHETRDDLRAAFDIETQEARVGLNQWLMDFGRFEIGLPSPTQDVPVFHDSRYIPWEGAWRNGGVNIIGFGRGEFGIGEDVRMASLALAEVDCDQCVPGLPLAIGARQSDRTLEYFEVDKPLYRTNMIFLPHYETVRLLGATGNAILGGRYNIGCWQWELPRYPPGLEAVLDVADEVWSSTIFTADAMRGATDKPVHVMPMAVSLPPLTHVYVRDMFGVPQHAFAFLHILDGNSSVYRKNPLAVVRAFLRAFPGNVSGVHLVLKIMNMGESSPQWDAVLKLVRNDPRVTIISGAFERERVVGLQLVCDCFVSLHRAEGFGRNIAEAMLLGKPVIASDFSGNRDFTTDVTAFLVGGETIPVLPGEYSFCYGQFWWDADIEAAAECMLRCVEDSVERDRRAANGKAHIIENYAPAAVGRNYAGRLRTLGLLK